MSESEFAAFKPTSVNSAGSTMTGNVAKLVNRLSRDFSQSRSSDIQYRRPTKHLVMDSSNSEFAGRVAYVRFSYKAEHDDELNLEVDDIIDVMEKVENGWLKGKLRSNGVVGVFPANFVSFECTGSGAVNERKKSFDGAIDGVHKGFISNTRPTSTTLSQLKSRDTEGASKGVTEMARVLFTYSPAHDDELELKEVGSLVKIISKKCTDKGWFYGELDGKKGLFPDNFVEIVKVPAPITLNFPKLTTESAEPRGNSHGVITAEPSKVVTESTKPVCDLSKVELNGLNKVHESYKPSTETTKSISIPTIISPPNVPVKPPKSSDATTSNVRRRLGSNSFAGMHKTLSDALSKGPPRVGSSKLSQEEDKVDDLSSPGSRLSHLTIDRPKQPNKRPPSMLFSRKSTRQVDELITADEEKSLKPIEDGKLKSQAMTSSTQSNECAQRSQIIQENNSGEVMTKTSSSKKIASSEARTEELDDSEFVPRSEYTRLKKEFAEFREDVQRRLTALEAIIEKNALS